MKRQAIIEGIHVEKIGSGLLNRDLIRAIKERWQRGDVGLLYVQLRDGCGASAIEALRQWESEQERLFWKQRLDSEAFYWYHGKPKEDLTEKVLKAAIQSMAAPLKKNIVRMGTALTAPSISGRSSQAMIYRTILEALNSAWNAEWNGEAAAARDVAAVVQIGSEAKERVYSNDGQLYAIGQLAAPFPCFSSKARVSEVAYMFDSNSKIQGAIIADAGRPVGLLMKEKLHQLLAGQFGLPLYWNRAVEKIMDEQPLIVDADMPVEQVSQLAMARDFSQLYDVVIITKEEQLIGAATIRSILECMTAMRTEAARTANPLTGLPGNEGIQSELQRRIRAKEAFAVIYADLDYFKWFNDYFGFSQGDDLIRYLANVLREEIALRGTANDFIGHIGGDDFIMVTKRDYAEQLCRQMIAKFDGGIKQFYGGAEVTSVEDRHGNLVKREGVTLSLSLMIAEQDAELTPDLISRTSAKLKKRAKAQIGSVYVMETIAESHHGEGRV
ncbi:GGDEF domain-containing protein [Paenibacillus sp. NEAU-GSW1]|uniref:GGDEF domain-containing protein n=1 Tax=Paenibacillus sp. NEAU-GSW1 TaxID=2682486 RepID=UPI00156369F7|nr:GGDEF domain-containing protein [Paenibacillus sp. NEAU-GSW1]